MTTSLARCLLSVLAAFLWAPTGFTLDERRCKAYDFSHQPITYPQQGGRATEHIDPAGKTWLVFMQVTPANKTADMTDSTMRAALVAQGWELLTTSGLLSARHQRGGTEQWFSGSVASGYSRATIIEAHRCLCDHRAHGRRQPGGPCGRRASRHGVLHLHYYKRNLTYL